MISFLLLAALAAPTWDRLPDLDRCGPGRLSAAEKERTLGLLNAIRKDHGLAEVTWDSEAEEPAARAALIMAAGLTLTHLPPKSLPCWSESGAAAAKESNLHLEVTMRHAPEIPSEVALREFLVDANDASIGHRRWILDPFLRTLALGRAEGAPKSGAFQGIATAFALKLIGGPPADLSTSSVEWIAYPSGATPAGIFPPEAQFSFSVLADRTDRAKNGIGVVDFSKATVTMTDATGRKLAVSGLTADYNGFGLPNVLRWRSNERPTSQVTVVVDAVLVRGAARRFEYRFRLV